MAVRGVPKLMELRLAQLNVDLTKATVEISTTAALGDPSVGPVAWVKSSSNVWSPETQECLKALIQSLEVDIARTVMEDVESPLEPSGQRRPQAPSGLGETLRGDEPPEM